MRPLTSDELPLVAFLFEQARISQNPDESLMQSMNDGGMGSLAFAPITKSRRFGRTAAECMFHDLDGVPVSAVLNLDQNGMTLDLDVFKANFCALVRWPSAVSLRP